MAGFITIEVIAQDGERATVSVNGQHIDWPASALPDDTKVGDKLVLTSKRVAASLDPKALLNELLRES